MPSIRGAAHETTPCELDLDRGWGVVADTGLAARLDKAVGMIHVVR
jgi:hypothetical protein